MNLAITLKNSLAAVALCAFGIGITPQAHAVAMYGADALVQVTLTGVSVSGGALDTDATATYQNQLTGFDATSTGLTSWAVADLYLYPLHPVQDMKVFDTMEHDHIVFGEAGASYGTAFSFLQSDGSIRLENLALTGTITFDFEYLVRSNVSAGVTGDHVFADAFANAIIEIFDDSFAFVDISRSISASLASGVLNDSVNEPGTFSVMLEPGQSSYISVLVNTSGGATYVPEPATLALFSAGLIGFAARRRRAAR